MWIGARMEKITQKCNKCTTKQSVSNRTAWCSYGMLTIPPMYLVISFYVAAPCRTNVTDSASLHPTTVECHPRCSYHIRFYPMAPGIYITSTTSSTLLTTASSALDGSFRAGLRVLSEPTRRRQHHMSVPPDADGHMNACKRACTG